MLGVTATNYHAPYCSALDFPRMHRFWDITELVLSVILLLSKGDQATLARVNHRLWEIAITEIWSSVPDFRYFMFLLPPKLRERSKDIESSTRQPFPTCGASDLDRLILHSQTTKTLHYRIELGASQVPIWIWNHDKLSTALPNLRSLKVSFAPWTPRGSIDTVSLLLRPTLRRVHFSVETSAANFQLSPALRYIAQSQALSLEEMSLNCPWGVQSLLDDGCAAILSQRNLQRLWLRSLADVTALACAAGDLPVLRELDVGSLRSPLTAAAEPAEPADGPQLHFRSLVTLKASGFPTELGRFLKNVGSKVLAHVGTDIEVRSPEVMDPDFFLVLHAFRAALITLEVTIRGDFTWIGLEPILDLGDLQKFSLTYNNNATIPQVDDAQVLRMTKAWPRLTSLSLSTRSRKANITLRGLGHIACNCPNLRVLLVAFDGTRQGNSSDLPPDDTSSVHREMELIDLLWSEYDPGDELRITTSFLRRWWPRAEIVGSGMGAERGMRWQEANTASRAA